MDEDDMAVLLQTAISEMQESRKQAEALMRQNQQLVDQNNQLTDKVMELVATKQHYRKQASKVPSVHYKGIETYILRNLKIEWIVKWLNLGYGIVFLLFVVVFTV